MLNAFVEEIEIEADNNNLEAGMFYHSVAFKVF